MEGAQYNGILQMLEASNGAARMMEIMREEESGNPHESLVCALRRFIESDERGDALSALEMLWTRDLPEDAAAKGLKTFRDVVFFSCLHVLRRGGARWCSVGEMNEIGRFARDHRYTDFRKEMSCHHAAVPLLAGAIAVLEKGKLLPATADAQVDACHGDLSVYIGAGVCEADTLTVMHLGDGKQLVFAFDASRLTEEWQKRFIEDLPTGSVVIASNTRFSDAMAHRADQLFHKDERHPFGRIGPVNMLCVTTDEGEHVVAEISPASAKTGAAVLYARSNVDIVEIIKSFTWRTLPADAYKDMRHAVVRALIQFLYMDGCVEGARDVSRALGWMQEMGMVSTKEAGSADYAFLFE